MKGKRLLRFAREELYPVPGLLAQMGLTYDEKLDAFKSRITKQFPREVFRVGQGTARVISLPNGR